MNTKPTSKAYRQQIELGLPSRSQCLRTYRHPRADPQRLQRARWWFRHMHHIVDSTPAPQPTATESPSTKPSQLQFPIAVHPPGAED